MKRMLLAALAIFFAGALRAQTVANFDTPKCSGNGVGTYQGINFSASPWDCESANIPGDATTTISWYQNIKSGTFKFVSPSVLTSLTLGASGSGTGGTFTISTDAGESLTKVVARNTVVSVTTGFTKAASVVTVGFTGGWTLELDNIAYQPATVTPPPPPTITSVSASCKPSPITPVQTSQCAATVLGTGAFATSVTWATSDGTISTSGVLTPSGNVTSATVTAVSTQDPTKSGTTNIAITLPPPPPTVSFTISGLPATGCSLSGTVLTCTGVLSPATVTVASPTAGATVTAPSITISVPQTVPVAHSAVLSWVASASPVAGYKIYRSALSGGYTVPLNPTLLTVTTFTDSTVTAGGTYFYVTTAVDSSGNESLHSNEVSATIPTP